METEVAFESPAFSGVYTFTDAKLVTRTKEALVIALTNAKDERVVITLPTKALDDLRGWRLFG